MCGEPSTATGLLVPGTVRASTPPVMAPALIAMKSLRRIASGLLLGGHYPIRFKRFTLVSRKCLPPDHRLRNGPVVNAANDDRLTFEGVVREKCPNFLFERTDYRHVQCYRVALHPIDGPEPGFWIEKAHYQPFFIRNTLLMKSVEIDVSETI